MNNSKQLKLQPETKHGKPKTKAGSDVFITPKINPPISQFNRRLSVDTIYHQMPPLGLMQSYKPMNEAIRL
jgi:hypothetical protein